MNEKLIEFVENELKRCQQGEKQMTTRTELGISDQDYEELLDVSENLCWICAAEEKVENRRLAIDHDHRTGAVRGLLCSSCNRKLGASVDPEWHFRAAEYLEVAARAFGDYCRTCYQLAPSRLIAVGEYGSEYLHFCCNKEWHVFHRTRGIPSVWGGGIPVPPFRDTLENPEEIGHPGMFATTRSLYQEKK